MAGVTTFSPAVTRLLEGCQPIIVANRAPLFLQGDRLTGNETLVRGAGGLVTAMAALAQATRAIWVAAARDASDRHLAERADETGHVNLEADGQNYSVAFISPSPEAYELYYNEVSNPLLWFIHHYLWDLGHEPIITRDTERAWKDGYVVVNEMFARRVIEEARAASRPPMVLIQDYQLYLVPDLVRKELPHAAIMHFIHVPWSNPAYWRILPRHMRNAILLGLLGNDIIGFHTRHDVRNFLVTCEELLHLGVDFGDGVVFHQGRRVRVRAYPLGIDVNEFIALGNSPEVAAEEQAILAWRPEILILRVDRTDLSKNIVRGFLAFERMLERHPELATRVQFWAYLQETRQTIDDYRSYLGNVLSTAARINRRFMQKGWMPVKVEVESNMNKAAAAYRQYDTLLVNPIYDGMNLVAKEGPLINQREGVLVLSENAGAHEELGEFALTVNPFDVDQTADALHRAITMDAGERSRRATRLKEAVTTGDVSRWISRQLSDLASFANPMS